MNLRKNNLGFTLIELLVVVSIISLLASIVFASLSDAREKARIAAGKQFSAIVLHAIGDQLVRQWNFDEGSGTVALDSSGNGNNGTIASASYVAGINGTALSFNGSSSSVSINSGLSGVGGNFSIGAWVNVN